MLKELRTQHRTVIQMAFSGFKNKEIAERMEMSDCTVSQIIRSPLGKAYLEGLQDKAKEATLDVRKKLVSLNSGALKTLERLLNPAEKAPHSVQLTAAKDVLDRTGYKAPDRLSVDMTMQTKTDQEIDAEINAVQQSINKTYLQDPNQSTAQEQKTDLPTKTEVFTDEPIEQAQQTVDNKDMDSSDPLVNFKKSNQDDLSNIHNAPEITTSVPSEESVTLLSKIPTNVFKS